MPARPATAGEWGILVAQGMFSEREAAMAMLVAAERRTGRQDEALADVVVTALRAETRRALEARTGFWADAVALVQRGIKARVPSSEIMRAVARLARTRAGSGLPLGCGLLLAEEVRDFVTEEIAMWVQQQKARAQ